MNKEISCIPLQGTIPYLFKRTKLRYLQKNSVTKKVRILDKLVDLDIGDLEQKYLANDCVREPENLIVYRAISESGLVDTFIDIGANCGHVAASIRNIYPSVLLFEPNPKLASLLRDLFSDLEHIAIKECAIVDEASCGELILTVPDDSSGLATLGGTALSQQHHNTHTYSVKASTFEKETQEVSLKTAYIKIDVEGFEENIINSSAGVINKNRPIVGFEALSNDAAFKCSELFDKYEFYCARFDFLENGGALSRSFAGILKSLIKGANIDVLKIEGIRDNILSNFSQVYAVPEEKSEKFESSIKSFQEKYRKININDIKAWS